MDNRVNDKQEIRVKRLSKSGIAIALSAIKWVSKPKVSAEQYITNSEIAATMLWSAYMKGDIKGKVIADLGCGSGILGIGALILKAKKVFFVEKDKKLLEIVKENLRKIKSESSARVEFICCDVADFSSKVDTVIMNPPFGTKVRHTDTVFLKKAFEISNVVYSFHKSETKEFIIGFANRNGFSVAGVLDFMFPLKPTMGFHKKRIKYVNVSCFRFVK